VRRFETAPRYFRLVKTWEQERNEIAPISSGRHRAHFLGCLGRHFGLDAGNGRPARVGDASTERPRACRLRVCCWAQNQTT
jgi:hypothetical protein